MTFETTWKGASNTRYVFQSHLPNTQWPYWGGIYMYCGLQEDGWTVYYIGETESFAKTIAADREAWSAAQLRGATHVHLLLNSERQERQQIKCDLLIGLNPIGNQLTEMNLPKVQGWV